MEEMRAANDFDPSRRQMGAGSDRSMKTKEWQNSYWFHADVSLFCILIRRHLLHIVLHLDFKILCVEMDARQRHGLTGPPNASISPQSDNIPSGNLRNYGIRDMDFMELPIDVFDMDISKGFVSMHIFCRGGRRPVFDVSLEPLCGPDGELPEKLRNLEPRLIEHVSNEIMDKDPNVRWDDIAGLDHAKKCVTEMVIWPLLRPDIFRGCRSPGRGLLLFGPPIGEGEKLVRALFGVASCREPAVIFVDEIDSLLSQRKSEGEHESSRRLKTQFLIEMEGFDSGNEQILLIGYSGSDMKNLVKEASMGPLREALRQGVGITKLSKEDMRPVTLQDFENALQEVRPSVSLNELGTYEEWNRQFGSLSI
ncbi:putative ATPase family AAA domain-containing protein FIGL1 [Cocos nucifera]|uniref:Putative ATPase family AAA domain-containing protein FIGL1 n=1 Tax=Cocos nucifera TaxID=13894 RepID=A0A8K0IXH8_COCNU|nr:putative ATPase family AAA domain-containing protein FIGL1 [Cocos nucifera]